MGTLKQQNNGFIQQYGDCYGLWRVVCYICYTKGTAWPGRGPQPAHGP